VVELGATVRRIKDPLLVLLENRLVCLDGHGDRLLGESCLHLTHALLLDLSEGIVINSRRLLLAVLARLIPGLVDVRSLRLSEKFRVVVESAFLSSTVAPITLLVAVDELLLAERLQFARFNRICGLEGPCR